MVARDKLLVYMKAGLLGSIFRPPWVGKEERTVTEKAHELLEYVGLRPAIHDECVVHGGRTEAVALDRIDITRGPRIDQKGPSPYRQRH